MTFATDYCVLPAFTDVITAVNVPFKVVFSVDFRNVTVVKNLTSASRKFTTQVIIIIVSDHRQIDASIYINIHFKAEFQSYYL